MLFRYRIDPFGLKYINELLLRVYPNTGTCTYAMSRCGGGSTQVWLGQFSDGIVLVKGFKNPVHKGWCCYYLRIKFKYFIHKAAMRFWIITIIYITAIRNFKLRTSKRKTFPLEAMHVKKITPKNSNLIFKMFKWISFFITKV